MNSLERRALDRALAAAATAGLEVPDAVTRIAMACGATGNGGALAYAREHPDLATADDATLGCCYGAVLNGLEGCTCWVPVYDIDQDDPIAVDDSRHVIAVRPEMCGDCAYRPRSPERSDPLTAGELLDLPATGDPFWCHQGMRRPQAWTHPTAGIRIDGSPSDYQPPLRGPVPYRADGTPGELCRGWAALVAKAADQ